MAKQTNLLRDVHMLKMIKRVCSAAKIVRTLAVICAAVMIGTDAVRFIRKTV